MRILLVEDNPKMAEAIQSGLAAHGHAVTVCHTGLEGEEEAAQREYDAIVLDRMLPDRDGVELCRSLRSRCVPTPILMLTAISGTQATVEGLDAGADDYLAKPFEFDELVARVRALLRRGDASESRRLKMHDLELDLDTREAMRAGERIKLTGKEFSLLEYIMRNPDRVLTRQVIAEKVWAIRYEPSSNVIDVAISGLRRKIDKGFETPLIHTVIGAGYRFGVMQ
ncbi:MAG: response regulator transcription factor [Phycisphaerales bacterium]|nr:response regulator transcription factor [Phycisphaerales bacterium]